MSVLQVVCCGCLLLICGSSARAEDPAWLEDWSKAPETFAQAIYGGCYLASATQCRIHVEPFTIPVNQAGGEKVAEFRIFANNVSGGSSLTLYTHHTSSTHFYKPTGNYTPSLVTEDFYGQCGQTYYLNILTRGDTSTAVGTFGNAGATGQFTCPTAPAQALTSGVVPENSLRIDKQSGERLAMAWDASCSATDSDYEIYAGRLGRFDSHLPIACTTAGSRTASIGGAGATDAYYLVVPRNGFVEGSYGQNSSAVPRPRSAEACLEPGPAVCG